MRILQYIFCFCSVLCAAAAIVVGMVTASILNAVLVAAGAILFAVLMIVVKRKLEPPAPKKRDFMDPDVPIDPDIEDKSHSEQNKDSM